MQLLVASLWDDVTLAVAAPRDATAAHADALLAELDARLLVCEDAQASAFAFVPSAAGWPEEAFPELRQMHAPPEPDARLLLRTSGTGGAQRWIALSDANLFAVLDSHLPLLDLAGASVLSVLPWHHAFGLVLGLLASLLAADEIVRDGADGRDLTALLTLARSHPITHVDLVPLLATRLFDVAEGASLLRGLRGGLVGGAPVSAALASQLAATRLRVGYGQTEAAPGIMLGDPGEWSPRLLGRPVGCEVRLDTDGALAFRGENACLGAWRGGVLEREAPERWVRTGDVVDQRSDGSYRFIGRASDAFKLPNGRFVDAACFEEALRVAFPEATQLLLRAHEEDGIELLVSAPLGAVTVERARLALPALPAWLRSVRHVDESAWHRTPKGDVDRARPLSTDGPFG